MKAEIRYHFRERLEDGEFSAPSFVSEPVESGTFELALGGEYRRQINEEILEENQRLTYAELVITSEVGDQKVRDRRAEIG